MLHLVKVKEEIVYLEVDPTFDEAIFSYIDKVYIKKISKYIYYRWVVKFVKSPLVQRRKGNHKQWVVTKLRSQIFFPTTYTETIDGNLVWSNFEDKFNFTLDAGKKEQYAQVTYPGLIDFLYPWFNFKKNKSIPLVGNA
jgi:hypothetical protein